MRVLVTGSAGFIGSAVMRAATKAGHDVLGLDVSLGQAIRDDMKHAVRWFRPEAVLHLAAMGDVYQCQASPIAAVEANVETTALVVEHCIARHIRLIHASTWEVTHPAEPYAITKAAAEQLVVWAAKYRGLSAVALRLGSAYGPGMRASQVIRKWIDMAKRGEALTIHGDGSTLRQWTHVDDIADAFVLAAQVPRQMTAGECPVWPVVGNDAIPLRSIAETIAGHYGVPCTFGAARPADVPFEPVDCTTTRMMLGWEPRRVFSVALRELM